jgi:hypothetical protein
MRVLKPQVQTAIETVDILCNKCGQSCKVPWGGDLNELWSYLGLIEVEASTFAVYDEDERPKFSLCNACWAELESSFTIPMETP